MKKESDTTLGRASRVELIVALSAANHHDAEQLAASTTRTACPDPAHSSTMPGFNLRRMMMSACMGAAVGGAGVAVSGFLQLGRLPPQQQILTSAAFMGVVFGAGSVVR